MAAKDLLEMELSSNLHHPAEDTGIEVRIAKELEHGAEDLMAPDLVMLTKLPAYSPYSASGLLVTGADIEVGGRRVDAYLECQQIV